MPEEGYGNVTPEELEAARTRPHDLDTKAFLSGLRKILKSHKAGTKNMIRVNIYQFKELHDGWMLKVQIEKFFDSISGGVRWVKGYLTEERKVEFEKILDALPRKVYVDNRDNSQHERPRRADKIHRDAPTDLDLETLWNTNDK